MKRCPRCKLEKPLSDFAVKNKERGKYSSECKKCHRQIRNKIYADNPGPDKERVRKRRQELVRWLREIRAERGCARCPEKHPAALDFHHRDPNGNEFSLTQVAMLGRGKERLQREIEKCEVLCSNCHRKLHWEDAGVADR